MSENGEIRDFTKRRKRIRFRVDDDVFDCVPAIPAQVAIELTKLASTRAETPEEIMAEYRETFAAVMLPVSLNRFMARLADREQPIDAAQLAEILPWLLEQYGFRPTQRSEGSSEQSDTPASGTSSTDGARELVSTPSTSPSPASST